MKGTNQDILGRGGTMDEGAPVGTRLPRLAFTDDGSAGLEPQLKGSTIKTITHPPSSLPAPQTAGYTACSHHGW